MIKSQIPNSKSQVPNPTMAGTTRFGRRVLSAVRRIPPGRVATYGDIAACAGAPRAWRAVGTILRECRDPSTPCHRVIGAGGRLGGYGGNLALKRALLQAEGLVVTARSVRFFDSVRWNGSGSTQRTASEPVNESLSAVSAQHSARAFRNDFAES
jgi:O-6-methylguanine DNA methyltransferase